MPAPRHPEALGRWAKGAEGQHAPSDPRLRTVRPQHPHPQHAKQSRLKDAKKPQYLQRRSVTLSAPPAKGRWRKEEVFQERRLHISQAGKTHKACFSESASFFVCLFFAVVVTVGLTDFILCLFFFLLSRFSGFFSKIVCLGLWYGLSLPLACPSVLALGWQSPLLQAPVSRLGGAYLGQGPE